MKSLRHLHFLLSLSALMAFTSLSVDIYLPAVPAMSRAFGGDAELTITGFLIGFALAQLLWGPISDRLGRKIPLFIGLGLFTVGSIGCALSDRLLSLIGWRVFQAFGACTGPLLARAMVRDLFGATRAAQLLSTLMLFVAAAPIVRPIVGGLLLKIADWHAHFWLLAGIGLIMLVAARGLPESLPPQRRKADSLAAAFASYRALLANWPFLRYSLCISSFYVAAYAFIIGSPRVYIDHFAIDPSHYGYWFGVNIFGVMALSVANGRLVQRFSLDRLLQVATRIAAGAALLTLVLAGAGWGSIWGLALSIFLVFAMNGIIASCSNAAALASVPVPQAGAAAALLGALQYGSGILSSLLLTLSGGATPLTLTVLMALFVGLSAALVWRKNPVIQP